MPSLVLFCIALVLAGCNAANNSQYQTPARGGWDNFRAETVEPRSVGRAS